MIAWMLYTIVVACLISAAALATEESARLLHRPQRWGWMGAMIAAVALPLLLHLLPARPASGTETATIDPDALSALLAQASVHDSSPGIFDALLTSRMADTPLIAFWLLAAAAMIILLMITYVRTLRVRAGAQRIEIAGVPALLTRSAGPMVVGVRRPEVVVPRWIQTLSDEERRLVVRHEWEHVRARDTRLLLASAVLLAAMPWNLPLWWMRRRLRHALEVDCDARVLATGADRRIYGSMLIQTAGRPGPTSLLAPALVELPSMLERRIVAMTAKSPAHRPLRLAVCASMGAFLLVAACELTPRGGALSPTEPTLADVLASETAEVDFTVVGVDSPDVEFSTETPVDVIYTVIGENGDSLRGARISVARLNAQSLDTGEANPIFVVDGERVESIEGVRPGNINRIEVLKGATAVSLFGPDAADGVVRITTGEPAVSVRSVVVPADVEVVRSMPSEVSAADRSGVTSVEVARVPQRATPSSQARPRAEAATGVSPRAVVAVGYGASGQQVVVAPEGVAAVSDGVIAVGYGAPQVQSATETVGVASAGRGTARSVAVSTDPEAVVAVGRGIARRVDISTNPEAMVGVEAGTVRAPTSSGITSSAASATASAPRAITIGPVRADQVIASTTPAPSRIEVRGPPSANPPLVIVDGRPVASLDMIDTSTIESISVLKDQAAIDRWGARGRNGVIEVTTKK